MSDSFIQSFYAVKNVDTGLFFAGFDPEANEAQMVETPMAAKLFSNKHQVKLRPNEKLVELEITLTTENVAVSEPFRPRRREPKVYAAS